MSSYLLCKWLFPRPLRALDESPSLSGAETRLADRAGPTRGPTSGQGAVPPTLTQPGGPGGDSAPDIHKMFPLLIQALLVHSDDPVHTPYGADPFR